MKRNVSGELEEINKLIKNNKALWGKMMVGRSASRFLGLLRSDLMRLSPENIPAYLNDDGSKLNEGDGFGKMLCKEFFSDPQPDIDKRNRYRDALIYACLEIEASLALDESAIDGDRKNKLKKKLSLWEVL